MAFFSHYPLQKGLLLKLTGDATLSGMVAGIYDRPPQNTAYPYVTAGESLIRDWSTKTSTGTDHEAVLHAWSREGGRKQAALIMERIHTLLHEGVLTVEGQTVVLIRFVSSAITLENDGWTYHGTMRFHVLLETQS